MNKIIACIDGSPYADSVCHLSAWAQKNLSQPLTLLHVVAPHSEISAKGDISGQIGLGAKGHLLSELSKIDAEHGKLEQRKGQLMLQHAKEELSKYNVEAADVLHRRGTLVQTIQDLESEADIIIMGKRGEHHYQDPDHLGSNLERVARAIHKPLLVASRNIHTIKKFLLAYDGSPSTDKAIDYIISSGLFNKLECHMIHVGKPSKEQQEKFNDSAVKLTTAKFTVHQNIIEKQSIEKTIIGYIDEHQINLLVMGAYGHSKIRNFILGSTTTTLLRKSHIPLMLFH